ncbi:1,4-alpha-glucan branching enzyme GlgB [Gossypium arboreum]|uniref:1,4-alpha-glucan branching enzyme GlgB n=1 Tax=Gossypium arboreum TaxID=29729 RepID=A0A0B0N911_GOSAR|nr:1,4-alpha-glucan branching enzyme GlgB [Gossypium arboreum]
MSQKGTKQTKSRRSRVAHTPVPFEGIDQGFHDSHSLAIDPHYRVQFNRSNMAWQSCHKAVAHGHVSFSRSCILHGKGYLGRKKANSKPI